MTYHWELPSFDWNFVELIFHYWEDNQGISDDIGHILFLVFLKRALDWELRKNKDEILQPLTSAANMMYEPAIAVLPLVYEYFGHDLPHETHRDLTFWMQDGTAAGSTIATTWLKKRDPRSFAMFMEIFRAQGGYNQFYTNGIPDDDKTEVSQLLNCLKNSVDPYKNCEAHYIAMIGDFKSIQTISLDYANQKNARNSCGQTPLYIACMRGVWQHVQDLLINGALPAICESNHGATCLHWTFNFDDKDISEAVTELIKHGADVNAMTINDFPFFHLPLRLPTGTPLHWAVAISNDIAIQTLLKHQADPLLRNHSDPYTRDHNVRYGGRWTESEQIIFYPKDSSALGVSALDLAVMCRVPLLLQCLLDMGVSYDLNEGDEEGYAPFHRLDAGHAELTLSESTYFTDMFKGDQSRENDRLCLTIHLLLNLGANINQLTTPRAWPRRGKTPLMLAVSSCEVPTTIALLEHGADPNVANEEGKTALMYLTMQSAFSGGSDSDPIDCLRILKTLFLRC